MKKSVKLIAALTATVLTLGVAGCNKTTFYPNFINPEVSDGPVVTSEKYVINVQSVGGTPLDNVQVNLVSNGAVVKRGLSINGIIEFAVGLGSYDLEVVSSSLPAGYSLPEETYKTSATSREEITIKLPSSLIPAAQSSLCTYTLGTIMRDFTFTDCKGDEYTLSNLLKTKKAVALNFWYTGCGPCRSEFPAIQKAYASRDDIEVLAICSTHQGDTNNAVNSFQEQYNLGFPMGIDTLGLNNSFGIAAFPTTVIIDRYGMIAYRSSGSETSERAWTALFNTFTSDNYVQNVTGGGNGSDDDTQIEIVKPNIEMPASSVLEAAANGVNFEATYRAEDDEYSWPWLAGTDKDGSTYIYASNTGIDYSYSIVYADIDLKEGDVLSLEYYVDSEANCDVLHILLDGDLLSGEGYSATDGWVTANLYVADRDRTVELAFVYQKDAADPDTYTGEDIAKVRNIHVTGVDAITSPIDVVRTCANGVSGVSEGELKYDYYADVVYNEEDGYYHKDTKDGALIYISLSQLTPWTDMHTTSTTTTNGHTYYSTLYLLTYYNYAIDNDNNFNVTIGDLNITDTLQTFWTIQAYMPGPFYLVPLTKELQQWAQKFTEDYEKKLGATAHDKEWLEFCYYYDHYGSANYEHEDGDCYVNVDHTRGLTIANSFEAFEKNDSEILTAEKYNPDTGRMKAEINYPMQTIRNGTYYKFTAKQTGVYKIRAYTEEDYSSQGTAPGLSFYDAKGNITDVAGEPFDFDQFFGEVYDGFNHYMTIKAGETVYMMLEDAPSTTGYYEFEIEYLGTTYEKLFVCSTSGGMWGGSSGTNYLGISVAYDSDTDCYYQADRNGNPIMDSPIYIDMVYGSFLYNELSDASLKPLEYIINKQYFEKYVAGGVKFQGELEEYLGRAKTEGVTLSTGETVLGFIKADKEIVEAINCYIDRFVDGGRGSGNGWLAFAAYVKTFG